MSTIYVLGAGFSKTCGIATDDELLDQLSPLVPRTKNKDGTVNNYIEAFREQNFRGQHALSFEQFMSVLTDAKLFTGFITGNSVWEKGERAIKKALKTYLCDAVGAIPWDYSKHGGQPIVDFVRTVDWRYDLVITFNYDLLLEAALERADISARDAILHMHGTIDEPEIAWPSHLKFAYRNTRKTLPLRWKEAFRRLRDREHLDELIFIGYSMPPFDLLARSLFNYSDWYNHDDHALAVKGRLISSIPTNRHYAYRITVVNPSDVVNNYSFFRKCIEFRRMPFGKWMAERTGSVASGPLVQN